MLVAHARAVIGRCAQGVARVGRVLLPFGLVPCAGPSICRSMPLVLRCASTSSRSYTGCCFSHTPRGADRALWGRAGCAVLCCLDWRCGSTVVANSRASVKCLLALIGRLLGVVAKPVSGRLLLCDLPDGATLAVLGVRLPASSASLSRQWNSVEPSA